MERSLWELIYQSLPAASIAVFGGFVSLFTRPQAFSLRFFLGGVLAAAFVGSIINIALLYYNVAEEIRAISIALGGYCARDMLELFRKKFLKTTKKVLEDDGDDVDDK